jgi:hypothetical protein
MIALVYVICQTVSTKRMTGQSFVDSISSFGPIISNAISQVVRTSQDGEAALSAIGAWKPNFRNMQPHHQHFSQHNLQEIYLQQ